MNSPKSKELTLECPMKKCHFVFKVNNEVFQNNGSRARCPKCGETRQHRSVIAHNFKHED